MALYSSNPENAPVSMWGRMGSVVWHTVRRDVAQQVREEARGGRQHRQHHGHQQPSSLGIHLCAGTYMRWGEVRWGEVRWGEVRWGEVRWSQYIVRVEPCLAAQLTVDLIAEIIAADALLDDVIANNHFSRLCVQPV
jgi:hypothetical protein